MSVELTDTSPEYSSQNHALTLEQVIQKCPIVSNAYVFGEKAHRGQFRVDEVTPYFTHCEAVARIIVEELGIQNDPEMIAAALLHDTVEDTDVTIEQVKNEFGNDVAFLVDGVSKFKSDKNISKAENDRETIRKAFGMSYIDPRVAVLKVAGDRVHNMRTMDAMPPEKQVKKAIETASYAKLAESLGMWKVMIELEDLALKYASPEDYQKFNKMLREDPRTGELFMPYMTSKLQTIAKDVGVVAVISQQLNGLSRLKHKMLREHRFEKINDVISFRVVVDDKNGWDTARNDCMKILGKVWEEFDNYEDDQRFDNFLMNKTDTGYSAIQITLDYPFSNGKRSVEIAITTKTREEFNNWGVVSLIRNGVKDVSEYAQKLVFTPTGEVKFFKPNATGYDFAYSIENRMGAQAIGMTVDGVFMPISTIIPNAATVDIHDGAPRIAPDPEAKNFVLPHAKKIIEKQEDDLKDQETVLRGREMMKDFLSKRGLFDLQDLLFYKKYTQKVVNILRHLGAKGYVSNLHRMIGLGQLGLDQLEKEFENANLNREDLKINSIMIEGHDVKNLLGFMGKTISKFGGNIKPMNNKPDEINGEHIFKTTFLVEDLPSKNIEKLKEAFYKNPAITKVKIV